MMEPNSKKLAFLNTLKDFSNKFLLYIFSDRKVNSSTKERCVIYLDNSVLYFLYADRTDTQIKLIALEEYSFKSESELLALIGRLSRQFSIKNTPIYWLLNINDYQLFFLDPLPVQEEEIHQALTWRLKATLQKMGETVIDYFKLPIKPGIANQAMITAVAAVKSSIERIANLCNSYQLNLKVIDIPELALRNLTAQGENNDKSTALLYVQGEHILLNITKDKVLYVTRKINFHFSQEENNLEQASLEIIRYFDYFQSYWRMSAPTRIYLIAEENNQTIIINKLSELLAVSITPFSMEHSIVTKNRVNDKFWLLLGELFREMTNESTKHQFS